MDEPSLHLRIKELHDYSFVWALRCSGQDANVAEDALQNVYLKILEHKAVFDGRSSFKTWLFAVIRYTVLDLKRSDRIRLLKRKNYAEQPLQCPNAAPQDLSFIIKRKIAELPNRQQEVLELAFYHDMTLEDIAQVLNISIGSVRQHYDRGKKKMRTLLSNKTIIGDE